VPPRRVCVFGDSHFAAIRHALNARLVPRRGVEIEFWGTVGNRFRHLAYEDGAIRPTDDFTARRFASVNARGRMELRPDDFDLVLFMGCRTRVNRLFMEFLHRARHPGLFLSSGVKRRLIADHLRALPAYGFAQGFAAEGRARIAYAPVSFQSAGFPDPDLAEFPDCVQGTAPERAAIWDLLAGVMAEDGITLIAQDDSTVVQGCFTAPAYASRHAEARQDSTHKNGHYGALVLAQALALLPPRAAPEAPSAARPPILPPPASHSPPPSPPGPVSPPSGPSPVPPSPQERS
jgi:hypothetical protein